MPLIISEVFIDDAQAKEKNPCAKNPCAKKEKAKPIRKSTITDSAKLMEMGEKLWNNDKLGKSGMSCATCHSGDVPLKGEDFLLDYWKRPIPLQVPGFKLQVPNSNSELRTPNSELPLSLHPDACDECHKEQYNDWKDSIHSKAMGAGLLSQLEPHNDPETAVSCYYCHAPMMEQSEVKHQSPVEGNYTKNPFFDNKLKLSGVSCSVCHLRGGKVYGPPAREIKGQGSGVKGQGQNEHSGFIEKDFFERAEFCAACHQMDEGYELNGKVLTNIYREWKNSFYGENNITCQNCHMPDRQHLWRGIHNPEMVRNGINIKLIPYEKGGKLVIINNNVGHFFPTYVTPLITVKRFMIDKRGEIIPSSLKEEFIGRKVGLDLTQEFFDTRIAPQKSFEFDYNPPSSSFRKGGQGRFSNGDKLVFEVLVYPDKFYNDFFSNMLKEDNIGIEKKELEQAWKNSSESSYLLWKKEITLK